MRPQSKKFRKRADEARPVRNDLKSRFPFCWACGEITTVCVHEIAGGPNRQKFLDEPCGLLVLCYPCNTGPLHDRSLWPQARQLALLWSVNPEAYDLTRFNLLVNPRAPHRITQEEVDVFK
jgi:hypothetical protein